MKRRKHTAVGFLRFPSKAYFHAQQTTSAISPHRDHGTHDRCESEQSDSAAVPELNKYETRVDGNQTLATRFARLWPRT